MALSKIKTNSISDDAITAAKIADGTIVAADLAADSVDSSELVDGGIDLSHMSVNSIDSDQYVDGSIDTAHIADNQVTLAKMAGLVRGKIIYGDASGDPAALTVGSANTVLKSDGTDISYGTIATANIAADAIDGTKLADNAVDSEHYAAASIDNEHLADDAVGIAELSATGTASSSTFLRGDNAWVAVTGTTINNNADNRIITGSGTANTLEGESTLTYDGTNLDLADSKTLRLGTGNDMSICHDGSNSYINQSGTGELRIQNLTQDQDIVFKGNDGGSTITAGYFDMGTGGRLNLSGFKTDGATTSIINDGGNGTDFRVESAANANMFNVNGSGNLVGIGSGDNGGDLGVGLHIRTADSGQGSVDANCDELVIENSAGAGMTILSGTSNLGRIAFGDSGNAMRGRVQYDHANDSLDFYTGGTEHMSIDSSGAVTKPLQPACMFQLDSSDTNTTGDGTTVQVGSTDGAFTEIFDVNGDLGATASFTAPVTGYYQVSGSISLRSLGAAHDDLQVHCVASNRTYTVRIKPADIADAYAASVVFPYSCLLDMDVNDTVYLTYRVRGGTKVVDPGDEGKHTIYLVC